MGENHRSRTDVENLLLAEMVEEDVDYTMTENAIDGITLENTVGLFGDISSEDSVEDMVEDDDGLF